VLRAEEPPATPDAESQPVLGAVGAVAARGDSVERSAAAAQNHPPTLAQVRMASGRGALLTRQSSERAAAAAEKAAAIRAQTRPSTVGDGMLRGGGGGGSSGGAGGVRPKSAYGDAQPKLRRPTSNRRR
jgi:hypothetical protein